MTRTQLSIVVVGCACTAAVAARQAPVEAPRFRVAVDVVTIDAVVTDRKGEPVRDLIPADFEVLQDGKRQKVTFAEFVPVVTVGTPSSAGGPSSLTPVIPPRTLPAMPAAPMTPEQVRRTIVLVVDDMGLSFEGMDNTRRALRTFVDTALLPTDLVAVVRTGEARGVVQRFTNDRGTLEAAIEALHYNIRSRKGVRPFGDVMTGLYGPEIDEPPGLTSSTSASGSMSGLNLAIHALRDLPGRKTVIFASEGFPMLTGTDGATQPDVDPRVRGAVDNVIDQATRSGVVIYTIGAEALQTYGLQAADDIHKTPETGDPRAAPGPDAMGQLVRGLAAARLRAGRDDRESLTYLAEQTGGFAVLDTNDLAAGLTRIINDVRDYYIIGYVPDRGTFAAKGQPPQVHKIAVGVKRAGVHVTTRKAFIGVSDPERSPGPLSPAQELVRAAMSPFSSTTIPVHAVNLAGYTSEHGWFVRSVLHIDTEALTFSTLANGTRSATVDLVGLVFNSDGVQLSNMATGFDITIPDGAAEQVLRSGFVYTTRVRIEKPGGYQLRYAVRDRQSGAIGAAGEFVDVADVKGGAFALSGVVLQVGDRTADTDAIDSDRFTLRPPDLLRVFAPGTPLSYSYEIYNPGRAVQTATSLWRGTERLTSSPPETLTPPTDGRPFAAAGDLTLATDLQSGTYVLQITATSDDPRHATSVRRAIQRLSFEVK